jgi:hypothetical protein
MGHSLLTLRPVLWIGIKIWMSSKNSIDYHKYSVLNLILYGSYCVVLILLQGV